ncbi:hypothetical protein ABK040_014357 [Willaertia magna]
MSNSTSYTTIVSNQTNNNKDIISSVTVTQTYAVSCVSSKTNKKKDSNFRSSNKSKITKTKKMTNSTTKSAQNLSLEQLVQLAIETIQKQP